MSPEREDETTTRHFSERKAFMYPFFAFHMLAFGISGFYFAYADSDPDTELLYMHGGIALFVYWRFYVQMFGHDELRWMYINAALGLLGIYAQIGWILLLFGREISDYPWYVHVVPFAYYVFYTFLIRQFLIDVTGSRNRPGRRVWVERFYVAGSIYVYIVILLFKLLLF